MRGLRVDSRPISMHMRWLCAGSSRKYCSPSAAQRFQKVRGGGQGVEALGELGPVALADARDQRLLAVEIDVERAGADGRLAADVVHGGAVKAGAAEALLGGIEDVLAPGALDVGLELGHCPRPLSSACAARLVRVRALDMPQRTIQNERPFYLPGTRRSQGSAEEFLVVAHQIGVIGVGFSRHAAAAERHLPPLQWGRTSQSARELHGS